MGHSWTATDGTTVHADARWLRSICECDLCGTTRTGLRWASPVDLAPGRMATVVDRVNVTEDLVEITFRDGHRSTHDRDTLERRLRPHPLGTNAARPSLPLVTRTFGEHTHDECLVDDDALHAAIDELVVDGVVHLTGAPTVAAGTAEFASRFGPVRETSYGRVQGFRTVDDPRTAAETGRAQLPHTDEPFRYCPPGFLFFHSVASAPPGQGSTILVDGFDAAERLRREHPGAFDTLASVPLRMHRLHDGQVHYETGSRVITLAADRSLEAVRLNTRCLADLDPTDARTDAVLEALAAFAIILADPAQQRIVHLEAGDMLAFDNHRIMHGRTAFESSTARHLLSCNVDRDAVHSTWRVLCGERGRPTGRLAQGPTT